MSAYTTKFSVNDTAYYIKHANVVSVVISDIFIHDFFGSGMNMVNSSSAINPPLISYKVTHSVNSSGVGSSISGQSVFKESELLYLNEATTELQQILNEKLTNLQALN